jgi:hypothetical protein
MPSQPGQKITKKFLYNCMMQLGSMIDMTTSEDESDATATVHDQATGNGPVATATTASNSDSETGETGSPTIPTLAAKPPQNAPDSAKILLQQIGEITDHPQGDLLMQSEIRAQHQRTLVRKEGA